MQIIGHELLGRPLLTTKSPSENLLVSDAMYQYQRREDVLGGRARHGQAPCMLVSEAMSVLQNMCGVRARCFHGIGVLTISPKFSSLSPSPSRIRLPWGDDDGDDDLTSLVARLAGGGAGWSGGGAWPRALPGGCEGRVAVGGVHRLRQEARGEVRRLDRARIP